MPRVHTQKAAKDYPSHGISKGDTYYSWSFRHGGKHMSKTYPRASQLTQSKMSGAYAAGEAAQDNIATADNVDDMGQALRDAADAIREVAQEYRDAVENMPENFQQGATADECNEKADGLDSWADSLESDADEVDALDATDYVNADTPVEDLPEELVEENSDGEKDRKTVEGIDDLTGEEKDAMLEAAREIALQNIDCPL